MEDNGKDRIEYFKDEIDPLKGILDKRYIDSIFAEFITSDSGRKKKALNELQMLVNIRRNFQNFSDKILLAAPSREKVSDGKITIGNVVNAGKELYPCKVGEEFFYNHEMLISTPNHGKSTFLASLANQFVENGISFVMDDPKDDFSGLLRLNKEIAVIGANTDLRLSVLKGPSGIESGRWRSLMVDALAHVGGWGLGVKGYLQKAIDVAVDEHGDDIHFGHIYEIINSWSETGNAAKDYRTVLLSRLELFNKFKHIFWTTESVPFEEMRWLIIRTHEVPPEVHSLILETILLREFHFRLSNSIKDERAQLKVFMYDEASKGSFAKSKEHNWTAREISTPPLVSVLTQARQFKIGIITSDQLYSNLSDSLKSVASTKIIGRINTGSDVKEISEDIFLDKKEILPKLQQGEWIVKTWKIPKPFLIKSPDFKIPKITEEEIEAHMSQKRFWIESEKEVEEIKRSATSTLSQDEWYLLTNILSHPFKQFSNRLKVGMGKGRLEIAKQSLIQKGLASEKAVRLGAYRPWKILELTDDAIKLLESVGHPCGFWRHIKHEGLEHVLWKYLISDKLKQIGFEPIKEKRIDVEDGYRIVDIYWEDRGKKYACEIECSTVDISNKLRVLDKLDIFALAYSTDEALNRASSWLAQNVEDYSKKVRVVLLSQYLKELQSLIGQDGSGLNSDPRTKGDSGSDETKGGLK